MTLKFRFILGWGLGVLSVMVLLYFLHRLNSISLWWRWKLMWHSSCTGPKLSRTEHTAIFNKSHGKTNNRTSNKGLHAVGRRYWHCTVTHKWFNISWPGVWYCWLFFQLAHHDRVDSLVLVNPCASQAGWIEWGYQKVRARLASFTQPIPPTVYAVSSVGEWQGSLLGREKGSKVYLSTYPGHFGWLFGEFPLRLSFWNLMFDYGDADSPHSAAVTHRRSNTVDSPCFIMKAACTLPRLDALSEVTPVFVLWVGDCEGSHASAVSTPPADIQKHAINSYSLV